jgi:hypothetical protein
MEERILNGGVVAAIVGIFMPWMSGEWLGGAVVTYSGLQFYTALVGIAILFLHVFLLLIVVVPMTGRGPLIRKRSVEFVRFFVASQALVLTLAALSVLTKVTFEFSRVEVRFGIYVTLIGSVIAALYSFLRVQEQRRQDVHELFRHPEDVRVAPERSETRMSPPPPPPPPAPQPEDHPVHPLSSHR